MGREGRHFTGAIAKRGAIVERCVFLLGHIEKLRLNDTSFDYSKRSCIRKLTTLLQIGIKETPLRTLMRSG